MTAGPRRLLRSLRVSGPVLPWLVLALPWLVLALLCGRPGGLGAEIRGGTWVPLGDVRPDASGHARLIAEHPALSSRPDRLELAMEPEIGGTSPTGPAMIAWSPQ